MEEPTDSADLPEMDDDDAAMRWLEGLAAKQGVGEEELLTDPEDRTDSPPDWVRAMADPGTDKTGFDADAGETVMETPSDDDGADWDEIEEAVGEMTEMQTGTAPDAMDWLESLGDEEEPETPDFISQPEEPVEDTPAWDMEETSSIEAADLPDWLKDQIEDAPEPGSGAVPSWLQDLDIDSPAETVESATPAEPAGDVPDWLQDLAGGESEPEPAEMGDVPDWLQQTMLASSPFARAGEDVEETVRDQAEGMPAAEDDLEQAAAMEPEGMAEEPESDVPDWLMDMVSDEEEQAGAPGGDVPDWLQQTILAPRPIQEEDAAETVFEEPELEIDEEPEDIYTWEHESSDYEEEAVTSDYAGGGETVLEEMDEDPAVEMHAEAEEELDRKDWWDRDTGSYERPVFPVEEAVDEMASETVMETPDEPAVEPVVEPAMDEPEMRPVSEAEPEMSPAASVALDDVREAMNSGDLETALSGYRTLVREKANLSEVIDDLRSALEYDHPVNIDVWATLGDAYAGNDNLQDALDAYTKAEELLR
jgi:tetratricopeptide (TPR) repeat protein